MTMEGADAAYSKVYMDRCLNPRNMGRIPDSDGFARITGPCGDTMEIFLKVRHDRVVNAAFQTDGCGPSVASGSITAELATGKSITEARSINQDVIIHRLGGLPEDSAHCALLAANTLQQAIQDYIATKREPWRRKYRNI